MMPDLEQLKEWLKPIEDPEMRLSLVDLGLIYSIDLSEEGKAKVVMTLTSPMCPAAGSIVEKVEKRLLEHEKIVEAKVELVFEPKWDAKTMASDEVKDRLGIW